jgi:hypothetical protein
MTRAQILKVTHFPYTEYDENGAVTYTETEDGHWIEYEHDYYGNTIRWKSHDGMQNTIQLPPHAIQMQHGLTVTQVLANVLKVPEKFLWPGWPGPP